MSSSTLNQQVLRGLSCRLFAIPILLVVLLMSATITSAQETTGTILGTVMDSSGAVIPNATVTLYQYGSRGRDTNPADGQERDI